LNIDLEVYDDAARAEAEDLNKAGFRSQRPLHVSLYIAFESFLILHLLRV
jgi:hypothetical protein